MVSTTRFLESMIVENPCFAFAAEPTRFKDDDELWSCSPSRLARFAALVLYPGPVGFGERANDRLVTM